MSLKHDGVVHSRQSAWNESTVIESDSDSDIDGDTLIQSPNAKDRETMNEFDEAARLLSERTSQNPIGSRSRKSGSGLKKRRKESHGSRLRRWSGIRDEGSDLVYEMEEGYKDSSSNSSTESLLLKDTKFQTAGAFGRSYRYWVIILVSITSLFMLLAYGAYHASLISAPSRHSPKALSNGTHIFEPTTILISLDGFRADFLQKGLTPSLSALVASGVSPKYMLPSFPSVTFPNHYTLVTGLYPESHGIVGNSFWDPKLQEEFYYTNTSISMQSKWWDAAEPLWETAEKQGLKTAIHMWPGSEAHIHNMDPTYLDTFNAHEHLPNKVDRILRWLDLKQEQRPRLIAAYVPDVDRDGHKFGPNSTEIRATIASADNMLTLLLQGLLERNLTEIVNLVVVSDHGMATMSAHRMVQLDDLIDMNLIDHLDGWPLRGLRLKNPQRDVKPLYEQLAVAAKKHGTFDVYTLETMPDRYHFSNNDRIAPLWIVPKTGWLVIERKSFDIAKAIAAGEEFHPIGIHGFDHEDPLMRAIFVARGPAFPHAPNSRVPVFQNIEVYNILCDSLGLIPHSSNGTIRLPLKTEGLHSEPDSLDMTDTNPDTTENSTGEDNETASSSEIDVPENTDAAPSTEETVTDNDSKQSWWSYLHEQLEKAKDWAKQIIDSVKNNKATTNESAVT